MEKIYIQEKSSEIVQNFIRHFGIWKDTAVFNLIPNILTCVTIDKEIIRKIFIWELDQHSKNPLNAFLKLFAMLLINRDNICKAKFDCSDTDFNETLHIDEKQLIVALKQIAEFLSSQNNAFDKESLRLKEKYEELRREYNRYREDTENQIGAYQIQTKSVAMNVQYLLAIRRKEEGSSADYRNLVSLLESLNMTAIWPEEIEESLLSNMFTILKIGIPSGAGIKPCIMLGQQMLLKGEIIEYVEWRGFKFFRKVVIVLKLLSLGYDLGDGETIVDGVLFEVFEINGVQKFDEKPLYGFRMPGSTKDGEAIPTGFGFNERNEIFLIPSITAESEKMRDIRVKELTNLFKDGVWPKDESALTDFFPEEFKRFKQSVQIFTDTLFSNEQFKESLKFHSAVCDEIVFCVGHPTKWNKLDWLIYKAILRESILGKGTYLDKKSSLILAAESRAAYLYMRNNKISTANLKQNSCSLLIDVGSSTIDITAVTNDSRNSQYNSGDNCLGVRSIDYLIKDWYVKNLDALQPPYVPNPTAIYKDTISNNPAQETALILICRMAKEAAFSAGAGSIVFAMLFPTKLTPNIINSLAQNEPLGSALKNIAGISDSKIANLNNQTWIEAFRNFLVEQKSKIEHLKLKINRVIMTGSATRMSFVPEIIKQLFSEISEDAVWLDSNPSRSISKGLALVGSSDAKSKLFQKRIQKLYSEDIPRIIKENLPSLADGLAPVVESIVTNIILADVHDWRTGHLTTIDNMISKIKKDLAEDILSQ